MPIKKNNTYYEEDNGKIYYFDNNDVKKDIPASAFSNLDETKYDVSSFEEVSSTFYTTANPSGFITSSIGELDNFYDKATINSMLADFGGFEVVNLTTGENPVPDVSEPKTTIIYLTKDSESQVKDPYTEWIYTSADASTTAWEVIGETTVDLTNYYTRTETSGKQELTNAFNGKQNVLAFSYQGPTITAIDYSAVGQVLQAGTDLVIDNGIVKVNTDGTANSANMSFVAGSGTYASGYGAAAFGVNTHAEGNFSFAEGYYTSANGDASHTEGFGSLANNNQAHAEGYYTSALGSYSHAEGRNTSAKGEAAHAEGYGTSAIKQYTHAAGYYTKADCSAMTVIGKYNSATSAAFVIGNGTAENSRSDAFIVNWDGTVSAKKFIEETPLAITGGDYVSVTEDTSNNKLIIDMNSEMGTMLTELSGVLSAKPSTGRYILGVDGGTLSWLEVNQ